MKRPRSSDNDKTPTMTRHASVIREAFTLSIILHSVYRCFKTVQLFSGQKGVYIPHGRASHSHLHIFCIRCLLAVQDDITIVEKRSTSSGTRSVVSNTIVGFFWGLLHGFPRQYRGLHNYNNELWADQGMSISSACVLLSVTGVANAF